MYRIWKVGTWNVRGINGKEEELDDEFGRVGLDILGVTETKKKSKGECILKGGHVLFYSGVDVKERAREGVRCIVAKDNLKYLQEWTAVTERILKLTMKLDKHETVILVVYGPNEDESVTKKDSFWEDLTEVTEEAKGRLIILGDLNGRVGKKDHETGDSIGHYGEEVRNHNGKRLLDFCIINDLIITNTFYEHKDIHRYTREVSSRDERSIIDYVIVNRNYRNEVTDTRVRRGPEIYSDHFLVLSKLRIKGIVNKSSRKGSKAKVVKEVIKVYRLRNKEIAEIYREKTEKELAEARGINSKTDIENQWKAIRDVMIRVAKQTCGKIMVGGEGTKKQTKWWSAEIKAEVKLKKQEWKTYLRNRNAQNYDNYKRQRIRVREMIKAAKQKSWEEFGKKMEEDRHGNQKLFYKMLKSIRKGSQRKQECIKSKQGELLEEDADIMARWKEYFEDILNTKHQSQENTNRQEQEKGVENSDYCREEIKVEEVQEAVRWLKRGKAAGHDGITPEMLKGLGKVGIDMLTELFNRIWKEEMIPQDWEVGIILPIHKKGNNRECTNYRGITLLSVALKVYERLLEKRLRQVTDEQLAEAQSGFRKGRGVQDHIFTLKQLIEKTKDSRFCVAFIDLEKAFDSVSREVVWNSLKKREIGTKLLNNIMSLYKNTRNYVRTRNLQSAEFCTKEGLRQGGVLSPALFNLVMDDIIKEVEEKTKKLQVGYRKMTVVTVGECAFADDLAVFAKNEVDLQYNLEMWKGALEEKNLKLNVDKTKVMSIGKNNTAVTIRLNGMTMEQTDSYRYLGVRIHRSGKNEAELNDRIENAMKVYHALNRTLIRKKEVSTGTKMTVYKTIFRPILIYGSESWVLTQQQRNKIQAVEMKFLRGVRGVTKRDRLRSEKIREDLHIEPILESIEKQQLKWFGHIVRMDETRQVKRVWQARTARRRTRGRPTKTWDNMMAVSLRGRGLNWNEAERQAKDKKMWAKVVHGTGSLDSV